MELLGRVVRGLEWVAADEVAALPGSPAVTTEPRGVRWTSSDLGAVLRLRTVDDVFLLVGALDGIGAGRTVPTALARRVAALDIAGAVAALRAVRALPPAYRLDVVTSLDGDRRFGRYAVEDAVGALLAPALGAVHSSRADGARPPPADVTVRVLLTGPVATIAVRVADRPLHRRAYKQDTGPGTLHPPVAAALVRLVSPADVVLDPFCGDGTIPVEAALAGSRALGADLDPVRLRNAAANAARLGRGHSSVTQHGKMSPTGVGLGRADAVRPPVRPGSVDAVVTNPPWAVTVAAGGGLAGGLEPFWRRLPALLTAGGRVAVVVDAALPVAAALERAGLPVRLDQPVRLAGRLSRVVVAGAAGRLASQVDHGRTSEGLS